MPLKPRKTKKCRICKKEFTPFNTLQKVCGTQCAIEEAGNLIAKKERKELAQKKRDLRTRRDWEKILTSVFNKYVRLRDVKKGCISCGKSLENIKFDAGHCFPHGHYPELRFDEDNVHGQCVQCNRDLHGNQAEYLLNLPKRIGRARYESLLSRRTSGNSNVRQRRTKEDVLEMIDYYRKKIKENGKE